MRKGQPPWRPAGARPAKPPGRPDLVPGACGQPVLGAPAPFAVAAVSVGAQIFRKGQGAGVAATLLAEIAHCDSEPTARSRARGSSVARACWAVAETPVRRANRVRR